MRAVIYLRVSTEDQYDSGAGLGAQIDACRAYIARTGLESLGPFTEEDGLSGDTPFDKCPGLALAVDSMRPGDILLVQKRDRIARDRIKIAMLETILKLRKCRLVSAYGEGTDSDDPNDPMAFMIRGMVDLFAEFEKLLIRFRTRSALRVKRRRLERAGKVPYGYELYDDGRRSKPKIKQKRDGTRVTYGDRPIALRPNAEEQGAIITMRNLREAGYTYRAIARHLNELGYLTADGKPWQTSSVHYLLKREPYGTPTEGPGPDQGKANAG